MKSINRPSGSVGSDGTFVLLAFSFSVTAASPFACNKSTRFTGRTPSSNAIASHSGRLQLLSRVERARGHDAGGCHVSCKAQLILPSSWTLRAMLGVPARRWIRDLQGFEIETVSAGKQRKHLCNSDLPPPEQPSVRSSII